MLVKMTNWGKKVTNADETEQAGVFLYVKHNAFFYIVQLTDISSTLKLAHFCFFPKQSLF